MDQGSRKPQFSNNPTIFSSEVVDDIRRTIHSGAADPSVLIFLLEGYDIDRRYISAFVA
jgi:hypothetical protein